VVREHPGPRRDRPGVLRAPGPPPGAPKRALALVGGVSPCGPATVTGVHLARALDDLLDSAQGVTRTLLGVRVDPATLPAGGALAVSPAQLTAQRRMMAVRSMIYRG